MTDEYMVYHRDECRQCNGSRSVPELGWGLFRQSVARHEVSADYPWWIEAGYSEKPPETVECDLCSGMGVVTETVPLMEAMDALGFYPFLTTEVSEDENDGNRLATIEHPDNRAG